MSEKIPYGHQWIDEEDIEAVKEVLRKDWITQGPKVEEFEEAMADYCNAEYAVAVSSGTAALHLAYKVAGISEGDEVITTPLTFAATANAVTYCDGRPVFADVKEDTLNINPEKIKNKINKNTKVLAPVDFAGHPCDYDEILKIADENDLLVIEDASHALGSEYKGKKVGGIADMTVLSFHPVKTITTGEGGMVLTDNEKFYNKLKISRHHGIVKKPEQGGWYYEIEEPGYNYRLTDFQSALGLSQLSKIDKFIKRRKEIVEKYNEAFEKVEGIITPVRKKYADLVRHLYVIQFDLDKLSVNRRKIFEILQEKGIGVQVHYIPVHLQPFYKKEFGYQKGDFPIAEKYYERAVSLPLFPKMSKDDTRRVIETVKEIIKRFSK